MDIDRNNQKIVVKQGRSQSEQTKSLTAESLVQAPQQREVLIISAPQHTQLRASLIIAAVLHLPPPCYLANVSCPPSTLHLLAMKTPWTKDCRVYNIALQPQV